MSDSKLHCSCCISNWKGEFQKNSRYTLPVIPADAGTQETVDLYSWFHKVFLTLLPKSELPFFWIPASAGMTRRSIIFKSLQKVRTSQNSFFKYFCSNKTAHIH